MQCLVIEKRINKQETRQLSKLQKSVNLRRFGFLFAFLGGGGAAKKLKIK